MLLPFLLTALGCAIANAFAASAVVAVPLAFYFIPTGKLVALLTSISSKALNNSSSAGSSPASTLPLMAWTKVWNFSLLTSSFFLRSFLHSQKFIFGLTEIKPNNMLLRGNKGHNRQLLCNKLRLPNFQFFLENNFSEKYWKVNKQIKAHFT